MRNQAWLASALLMMACLGLTTISSAQVPPAGDAPEASAADAHSPDQEQVGALLDQEARTRFQLGSTLYRQGRFDDAAREFRAAYDVSHRPELLYNLYLVERDAGHTLEAADALRTYLRDASEVPDRGLMEGRLAALDRQLAAETISQQEHATPNEDGSETASGEVALPSGSETASGEAVPPIDGPPPSAPSRVLPISLMAAGGAVVALGAVFAILAKNKHGDLESSCDGGVCLEPGSQSDIDAMGRDALLADLSFAVGGASVATGLLLYLIQGAPDAEPSRAQVSAGCDGNSCGVRVAGRF